MQLVIKHRKGGVMDQKFRLKEVYTSPKEQPRFEVQERILGLFWYTYASYYSPYEYGAAKKLLEELIDYAKRQLALQEARKNFKPRILYPPLTETLEN